jgi:dimeric dUTPase (all-alpha-NTP-PPase superfamily)
MLITSRKTKLFQLQLKLDAHILNVCKLHYENSFAKVIIAALIQQESVQRRFDSHLCSVESFRNLSQKKEDEHDKL